MAGPGNGLAVAAGKRHLPVYFPRKNLLPDVSSAVGTPRLPRKFSKQNAIYKIRLEPPIN
jgi:hypothetical protein